MMFKIEDYLTDKSHTDTLLCQNQIYYSDFLGLSRMGLKYLLII